MWLYILIAIVVVLVLYVLSVYNTLVRLNNNVKEAFSTMDVYLKKRWDLIPNLVETVKGYAKHEENTLKEVVELRNSAYESMSDDEKLKTNQKLSQGITKIMALAEAYPDLKANENFNNLNEIELFNPVHTWKRKKINNFYTKELLVPIFKNGKLVYSSPSVKEIREYAKEETSKLWPEVLRLENPHKYYVDLSQKLWNLKHNLLEEHANSYNK